MYRMFSRSIVRVLVVAITALAAAAIPANSTEPNLSAAAIWPISFPGNPGAIQSPGTGSDTRIYYQTPTGDIDVVRITAPFTSGHVSSEMLIVPANEVISGTPIVALSVNAPAGADFTEVHLYFFSPNNILSEYIFSSSVWRGGPTCTDCLTRQGFVNQAGSKVLYAMLDTTVGSLARLRVGFVSAGSPLGLTEADWDATNGWRLATMNM
ncbi:hypothetical protein C8F01DRAFT_1058479 [Mycena amicta]|nr:hypothetical protein C8F01DRAFT_1058479 [Mycena amicta]